MQRIPLSILIGLVVYMLAGCGAGSDSARSASILMPAEDAAIYHEVLSVHGTTDRAGSRFVLLLRAESGEVAAQVELVSDTQGEWRVDLLHGYRNEPEEFELLVLPAEDPTRLETPQPLATRRIVLAGFEFRP